MFKGLINPGNMGKHELWVKCTTSVECRTDRSVVLTVKSGLDPHMINKLEDEIKSWFLVGFLRGDAFLNA
jgi:hypothetical protein